MTRDEKVQTLLVPRTPTPTSKISGHASHKGQPSSASHLVNKGRFVFSSANLGSAKNFDELPVIACDLLVAIPAHGVY